MKVLTTRSAYYKTMSQIEDYLQRGFDNLTEEESNDLETLTIAAEAWEKNEYPMPMTPSFVDILNYIMKLQKFNQVQLSKELQISKSALSEILSGKKKPSLEVARTVHQRFNIDGNLLLTASL